MIPREGILSDFAKSRTHTTSRSNASCAHISGRGRKKAEESLGPGNEREGGRGVMDLVTWIARYLHKWRDAWKRSVSMHPLCPTSLVKKQIQSSLNKRRSLGEL